MLMCWSYKKTRANAGTTELQLQLKNSFNRQLTGGKSKGAFYVLLS
jgi:hypothetical protein